MTKLIKDQQELVTWVREQAGRLDLAVAFWGKGASKELGLHDRAQPSRILLELSQGGSSPDEVRQLMKLPNVEVKTLDRLHAKAYIGEEEMIVGSANASAGGLGIVGRESVHWTELGVKVAEEGPLHEAKSWFDAAWIRGKRITKTMLDAAQRLINERNSKLLPSNPSGLSILQAVKQDPDAWKDARIWVVVATRNLGLEGQKLLNEARSSSPTPEIYAYENWPDIPRAATLISLTKYENEKVELDDPPTFRTPEEKQPGKIQLVFPEKITGYTIGTISEWRPLVERAEKTYTGWIKHGGISLRIHEFVRRYG
ncbi:phospholipase D family protein [Xanthomonas campestris]|uniref:phospholipase D family protein n=1 Tax=Xanthomonas campestris TaxID=339 RepID=UPI002B22539F|nr:phospholipase D family protein [Xanthomonas campestris]MEA9562230.1 phospholipase D family protein [Xanthomonas campestris]MEA9724033.1 phospholipase D family protein [Xanthomonas campestris]MEB1885800.1 phospholipase D family protein [Xanthomonas campestris pv. campestris]